MFRLVGGREGPFDRSQNMGPNLWNFFGIFLEGRDSQKFRGAVGSLDFENVALNHVFVWKMQ